MHSRSHTHRYLTIATCLLLTTSWACDLFPGTRAPAGISWQWSIADFEKNVPGAACKDGLLLVCEGRHDLGSVEFKVFSAGTSLNKDKPGGPFNSHSLVRKHMSTEGAEESFSTLVDYVSSRHGAPTHQDGHRKERSDRLSMMEHGAYPRYEWEAVDGITITVLVHEDDPPYYTAVAMYRRDL